MGLGLATPSDQACLLPLKTLQKRRLRLRGRATQACGITGELGLEMSKPGFILCESFSFPAPLPLHCFVWGNLVISSGDTLDAFLLGELSRWGLEG